MYLQRSWCGPRPHKSLQKKFFPTTNLNSPCYICSLLLSQCLDPLSFTLNPSSPSSLFFFFYSEYRETSEELVRVASIYLFMAVLGLRFCARAFSSCGKWGPLFIAVHGPLTIAASLVAEHRLQTRRLSNCGSQAQLLRGMWDLPRPGLEPISPALAGRPSTTVPPGKPPHHHFWLFSSGRPPGLHIMSELCSPEGQDTSLTEATSTAWHTSSAIILRSFTLFFKKRRSRKHTY